MTAEYWCQYCSIFVSNVDEVMKCHSCGEYKGLVKVSEGIDIGEL